MPTLAGVHPTVNIYRYDDFEKNSILQLSRDFFITRAIETSSENKSRNNAFLARPTDRTARLINTDREIAVVCSSFETFEARTLDLYKTSMHRVNDENRIDSRFRILVSADPDIELKISRYLQSTPEYPVIIPIYYKNLTQHDDAFVDALRRNHLIRDLFGVHSPLEQEYFFFGRSGIVNSVIDHHKSGEHYGIFGLRRSGKTSTIHAVSRKARGQNIVPVIIDCQDPAVHARGFSSLLQYLLSTIRKSAGLRPLSSELSGSVAEVSEAFRNSLANTLSAINGSVLLIFDEIENISPRTAASQHWKSGDEALFFWQVIRAFCQSQKKLSLTICFVGTNPSLLEDTRINGVDNPIFMFAERSYIPNLSFDETRQMITNLGTLMGMNFPTDVIAQIHMKYGGHPFFSRQICSIINKSASNERPLTISMNALVEAELRFRAPLMAYMEDIISVLERFYPDEFRLIEYLAKGDRNTFHEFAEGIPNLVEHLLGYGVVSKRGDDFEIVFDAVRDAVIARTNDPVARSSEDRRLEISRRRNRLEQEMRASLFSAGRSMSEELLHETLRECMTGVNYSRVELLDSRRIFSRGGSPLYFIDLIKILESGKILLLPKGRREAVLSALFTINGARADAHAKSISEESFRAISEQFDIAEDEFLPPE